MINASAAATPPVPAPRTKIRQRMNSSSSAAGNSSSVGDAPSSTSHTGSRKPRSIHPWMTLVHSGPWTQLPPAPAPTAPPASSWFKPRVPPRNPFGEVAEGGAREEETESADSQTKHREEETESADSQTKPREEETESTDSQTKPPEGDAREEETKSAREEETESADSQTKPSEDDTREEETESADSQTKPSEDDTREEETESADSQTKPSEAANIPSVNNADDQQNNSPDDDAPSPVGSSDTDNTDESRSDGTPAASAEKPTPPKKRHGSKGPPASDSTQRDDDDGDGDEYTGSSRPSGVGRTAGDGANSNAPAAANAEISSTEIAPGVFHFSGTVSGDPESEGVASGLVGMPEWNNKGPGKDSDAAAVGFEPGVEEVTRQGVEVPDLGALLRNKLDLAGALRGVPSLAAGEVATNVPHLSNAGGVLTNVPHLSNAGGGVLRCPAGNVGIPDMADVVGTLGGGPDLLSGAMNPFEEVPDFSRMQPGLGIPHRGGGNGTGGVGGPAPGLAATSGALGEFAGKKGVLSGLEVPGMATRNFSGALSGVAGAPPGPWDAAETLPLTLSGVAGAPPGPWDAAETLPLTKSASVPTISSSSSLSQSPSASDGLPDEARESASFSKACKENPFDRKVGMPKSKTFQTPPPKRATAQTPPPKRATAPGYGFPLIKRKVQTDSVGPVEDLEEELGELDRQVETLDLKGLELEQRLRNSQKDDDEEKMLMDWLTLIRQKHVLVRRDAELLYLTKQQHLEERQADVEYGLRCLLNKPESGWSQEDRGREQQLMDELVTIIEQRNHIISSLDQDRQSEREEDLLFEAMMKRKDFQKEGLKELKKSKGRFKLMKVLKMLSQRSLETSGGAKDSKDKKKS